MTDRQREVMRKVVAAYPAWFRAEHPGQRVTLASLFRHGALERRCRRGVDGAADASYEYQPALVILEGLSRPPAGADR